MTAENENQGILGSFAQSDLCGVARWKIFLTIFATRLGVAVLALAVVFGGWFALKPEKPTADRPRVEAAKRCAQTICDELRTNRGDYRSLYCQPFVGDSSGAVFETTRETLASTGTFDVCDKTLRERVCAILDLKAPDSNDAERAARIARRFKADAALCGSVTRFETVEGRAALVVDYRLIDATTGEPTFLGTYDSTKLVELPRVSGADEAPTSSAAQESARGLWFNFALWILAVLAIPIFAFRALEVATAKRSNGANAFALAACLLADAAFALILLRPTFDGKYLYFSVALMALFAIWYDAQILRLAYRRTSDVFNKP